MVCPLCQAENLPTAGICTKCSTPLPWNDPSAGATISGGTLSESPVPRATYAWSIAVEPAPDAPSVPWAELVGTLLAERYEILELLGQGGMGAVYKARDAELERLVALKLIRPELASNPEILRRFKQELILAREVTHRNVIRIFDLGQAKGIKFITMEFVDGRDLRAVLREKGKLPFDETLQIIVQVCRALEAAHAAGVVHRDLKPQNIMLDSKDRVFVMDFGIAHSLETPGMTQTGALMGTPEYMSPEQAKGMKVDARSDLFALGIIYYEMLTGISPYKADTALATLLRRTQERVRPPAEIDPTIPKAMSDVVVKCLEIEREHRYSTAREILEDLGQEMPTSSRAIAATLETAAPTPSPGRMSLFQRYRVWIGGLAAVVLLVGGWAVFRGNISFGPYAKSAAPVEQASLAILPFRNASGDALLDWLGPSLADMLSTDVGQSARLRTISPDRLHQVLSDLRITPGISMDSAMIGRIAEFSNADTVVWGQYAKFGDQIRIDATLLDLKHNRREPLKIEAASEKEIPGTVDGLAELIRRNLAVSTDVLKELKASSFQPTSKSMPALRDYNRGVQLLREGRNVDALKALQAAVQEDPQFALAYSRMAETDSALGYDEDAEKSSREALELSQQLPLAERYWIEANHARVVRDNKKAIEAFENLARTSPGNNDIQYALGNLYLDAGDLERARVHFATVLKAEPKNLDALIQSGWLEVQNGSPQSGLESLNRALSLAVEVDNPEQKAQVLQAIGMAYEAMNKFDEALRNLEQARGINEQLGKKAGIASSLVEIANVQSSLGKPDIALEGYTKALSLRRAIGAKRDAANTLIAMGVLFADRGQSDQALQLYKESLQMQRDVGDESNQALCLNNIGAVYEQQGKNDDALTYYQQSLQLREKLGVSADIADSLHNLGGAYIETAQYDQAMASYMRALDIRHKSADNPAGALESDGIGLVLLYQGRLGPAVNSLQEAVKGFREAKDHSGSMGQLLSDFGRALAKAGRGTEAEKVLEEAQGLAIGLRNDKLLANILNTQAEVLYYGGDLKAAKSLFQSGLQAASRSKAQDVILASKLNLAEVAIAEGHSQTAISDLRVIVAHADSLNLKYLSLGSAIGIAAAMIDEKDYSHALPELERDLGTSEKLSMRLETTRIHYLLGKAFRLSGNNSDAAAHYAQALSLINDARKEPGAERLLDRADLKSLFGEASQFGLRQ